MNSQRVFFLVWIINVCSSQPTGDTGSLNNFSLILYKIYRSDFFFIDMFKRILNWWSADHICHCTFIKIKNIVGTVCQVECRSNWISYQLRVLLHFYYKNFNYRNSTSYEQLNTISMLISRYRGTWQITNWLNF